MAPRPSAASKARVRSKSRKHNNTDEQQQQQPITPPKSSRNQRASAVPLSSPSSSSFPLSERSAYIAPSLQAQISSSPAIATHARTSSTPRPRRSRCRTCLSSLFVILFRLFFLSLFFFLASHYLADPQRFQRLIHSPSIALIRSDASLISSSILLSYSSLFSRFLSFSRWPPSLGRPQTNGDPIDNAHVLANRCLACVEALGLTATQENTIYSALYHSLDHESSGPQRPLVLHFAYKQIQQKQEDNNHIQTQSEERIRSLIVRLSSCLFGSSSRVLSLPPDVSAGALMAMVNAHFARYSHGVVSFIDVPLSVLLSPSVYPLVQLLTDDTLAPHRHGLFVFASAVAAVDSSHYYSVEDIQQKTAASLREYWSGHEAQAGELIEPFIARVVRNVVKIA